MLRRSLKEIGLKTTLVNQQFMRLQRGLQLASAEVPFKDHEIIQFDPEFVQFCNYATNKDVKGFLKMLLVNLPKMESESRTQLV